MAKTKRINDLVALAREIGAELEMSYSGRVFVDVSVGWIDLAAHLLTIDPRGEREEFEYWSRVEGATLSRPMFMIDGERFSEKKARKILETKRRSD